MITPNYYWLEKRDNCVTTVAVVVGNDVTVVVQNDVVIFGKQKKLVN